MRLSDNRPEGRFRGPLAYLGIRCKTGSPVKTQLDHGVRVVLCINIRELGFRIESGVHLVCVHLVLVRNMYEFSVFRIVRIRRIMNWWPNYRIGRRLLLSNGAKRSRRAVTRATNNGNGITRGTAVVAPTAEEVCSQRQLAIGRHQLLYRCAQLISSVDNNGIAGKCILKKYGRNQSRKEIPENFHYWSNKN